MDEHAYRLSIMDWVNKCCTKCRKPLVYEDYQPMYAGWRLDCTCWDEPPSGAMNTSTGATAASPETPLEKEPPAAADIAAGRTDSHG